ncbi:ribonuclease H-like domain, reverse transcriptase, RNA-dependent DNA polymerase [Tanacetum coccineum]
MDRSQRRKKLDSINRKQHLEINTTTSVQANWFEMVFKTRKMQTDDNQAYKSRCISKKAHTRAWQDLKISHQSARRNSKTIRLLLAIAANNKWQVHHLDVKSAFLHGDLQEEVYVTQPEGFIKRKDNGKSIDLLKALYGSKSTQTPRLGTSN